DFNAIAAEIDHRLDGKEHAGLERDAVARAPIMDDVGQRVEYPAHAVAAEIAHHRTAFLAFRKGLDRMADVAGGGARPDGGNPAHHGFIGDVHKAGGFPLDVPDQIHAAGVAVPAVQDHRHVDVHDVAVAQRPLV